MRVQRLKSCLSADPIIIRVDRLVPPNYPEWTQRKLLRHPELECWGPTEYDLRMVQQLLHDEQDRWVMDSTYRHIIDPRAFPLCLNLQDGLAIQQKGIAVFRELFGYGEVLLWGSVVNSGFGPKLPLLCEGHDKVVVEWRLMIELFIDIRLLLRDFVMGD